MAGWLAGRLAGRLAGWRWPWWLALAGRLAGRLAVLAGWLAIEHIVTGGTMFRAVVVFVPCAADRVDFRIPFPSGAGAGLFWHGGLAGGKAGRAGRGAGWLAFRWPWRWLTWYLIFNVRALPLAAGAGGRAGVPAAGRGRF